MASQKPEASKSNQDTGELWRTLGLAAQPEFDNTNPGSLRHRPWFRVSVSTLIVLLPIILWAISWVHSATRPEIMVAGGQPDGRHARIAAAVKGLDTGRRLEPRDGPNPTRSIGSLENLRRLQVHDVDFALYQSHTARLIGDADFKTWAPAGTIEKAEQLPGYFGDKKKAFKQMRSSDGIVKKEDFESTTNLRFVANLFPEVAHLIVHSDAGIKDANDLAGKTIAIGEAESGHYAMSKVLLKHLDIPDDAPGLLKLGPAAVARDWNNQNDRQIDAAILTTGLGAKQINDILGLGKCRLLSIPRIEALCLHEVFLSPATIPFSLYKGADGYLPTKEVNSVSVMATLLAHKDVPNGTVERITASVLSDEFLRTNELDELFHLDPSSRRRFAQAKPEYEIHAGARGLYDPHEFDAGAFEGWEALYSLIASAVLAAVVVGRWLLRRRDRLQGHRLDVYLKSLLKLELRQAALDSVPGRDDSKQLQAFLHEITALRQQALGEFSAHQLNDDPAQYCFLEMCHYISEKINSKLLRQRLDRRFRELREALDERVEARSEHHE